MAVTHKKTLVAPSSGVADKVYGEDWNDTHDIAPDTIAHVLSDHDKAAHDTLGIDAATLDGDAKTAFAPAAHTHPLADGATDVTASAAELNALDGITADVTELNCVDGVTSNIQDQLDDKADLVAGYVPNSQLGSGTPTGTKFLRDDSTWQDGTGGTLEQARAAGNQIAGDIDFNQNKGIAFLFDSGVTFPATPAIGQPFVRNESGTYVLYTWDGAVWRELFRKGVTTALAKDVSTNRKALTVGIPTFGITKDISDVHVDLTFGIPTFSAEKS